MNTFDITVIKVEAKSITVTVDASNSFEATREAAKLAEKACEGLWQKDYEGSWVDYRTQLRNPTE